MGTYIADRPDIDLPAAAALAPRIAQAAVDTVIEAAAAVSALSGDHEIVARAEETAQRASDTLRDYDIVTGGIADHSPATEPPASTVNDG